MSYLSTNPPFPTTISNVMADGATRLRAAVDDDNLEAAHALLRGHQSGEPITSGILFLRGRPLLAAARSKAMVDLLLEHGARLERVSQWWGPGFGTHEVRTEIAAYLVERGARVSAHAAQV